MSFLGEDIKKLGFGLMRLPQKDGVIDLEQTKQMVDMFLKEGFTYFDTAWAYPGSEDAIRITYSLSYYDTAEQELETEEKSSEILESLDLVIFCIILVRQEQKCLMISDFGTGQ